MARFGSILIAVGAIGAAGLLFVVGFATTSGENGYVYWAIRAPIWSLGVLALILGAVAACLAWRSAEG